MTDSDRGGACRRRSVRGPGRAGRGGDLPDERDAALGAGGCRDPARLPGPSGDPQRRRGRAGPARLVSDVVEGLWQKGSGDLPPGSRDPCVRGVRVDVPRGSGAGAEVLQVVRASRRGVSFHGSGQTRVTTPAWFRPGSRVRVSDELGAEPVIVTAGRTGRLSFTVDLGPPHAQQQYRRPPSPRSRPRSPPTGGSRS